MITVKKLLIILLVACCTANAAHSQATHAEATSQKWKGIDVSTVLGNSAYNDNNKIANGFPIILFNVGTGRFIIEGGLWGVEGRLLHPNFGRTMYLYSSGRINSGVTEASVADSKNSFGCNVPEALYNNSQEYWNNYAKRYCFTTIMDLAKTPNANWKFIRVEDPSNTDTYTYYMYEQQKFKTANITRDIYLGAAWGEWHDPVSNGGKGDGEFVFLDDDRTCWTTATVRGNTNKLPLENGDEVEIQELYQWRLISQQEFIDVLNSEGAGLNPSVSSLVPDRDFTRNSDDFHGHWLVAPLETASGYTYGTDKRYAYTWGNYAKNTNQTALKPRVIDGTINSESLGMAWDSPVRLKEVFSSFNPSDLPEVRNLGIKLYKEDDTVEANAKCSKYGFLNFEGVGTVSASFQITKPGWYQIECAGFVQSQNNHDAWLFARVLPNADADTPESNFTPPATRSNEYARTKLDKVANNTYPKNNIINNLKAGVELLNHVADYRKSVEVCISQEQFDAGTRTIRIGIRKEAATKSSKQTTKLTTTTGEGEEAVTTETTYEGYYDTDRVCVDDIKVTYMGLSPVFFYERMENLQYLDMDIPEFHENEFTSATGNGRYSGAAYLNRKFTTGEWNTFSFPIPLTGEQVRHAFGQNAKLLRLHSIGELSHNPNVIDFETVNLLTTEAVINPGTLYMLKPTEEPIPTEIPNGSEVDCYSLGKLFFSTAPADENNAEYNYPYMNLATTHVSEEKTS